MFSNIFRRQSENHSNPRLDKKKIDKRQYRSNLREENSESHRGVLEIGRRVGKGHSLRESGKEGLLPVPATQSDF